eukprot:gnl/TRDRNA2_/TRDRNA2_158184_c0_seq1.p1 gnl/TRDRNA2_/TRDRNA2_158184_c0~~gnl/TRDRNA2_/TRDRNA2_158184_c0_seq1.p1  ORF type:complete len:416 (+),score=93.13 gnl/TRDRNA2_/TRDRNA2_158184_c0_seq1:59-1306(+)
MAEFLSGSSGHPTFAPLTHGQTVAIARHLQEQIGLVQERVDGVQQQLQQSNESLQSHRNSINGMTVTVTDLQNSLNATNATVETMGKDFNRTNACVQQLQARLQQSHEDIISLREGQNVMSVNLRKCGQDQSSSDERLVSLREMVEQAIANDLVKLTEAIARTELQVMQLSGESASGKKAMQEQREAMRLANKATQGNRDDLMKTNTVVHILEQRLGETAATLKAAKMQLDGAITVKQRLQEEHEVTKSRVEELQKLMGRTTSNVQSVHNRLEDATKDVATNRIRLDMIDDNAVNSRKTVEQLRVEVNGLRETQELSNGLIRNLQGEVGEVGHSLQVVRDKQKETSALLLPNINMEKGSPTHGAKTDGSANARKSLEEARKSLEEMRPSSRASVAGIAANKKMSQINPVQTPRWS